jgi:16S rRNA (uracil1498-N3)-methyltransferase
MSLFFAPDILASSTHYQMNEDESKHCVKVLRLGQGAKLTLVNGKGLEFSCILKDPHPKRALLEIQEVLTHPQNKELHIAMAPTKNMDRIEWFLEKATEIGISKITFLFCEHNERKTINLERLQKIAIAAMKQSKRFYLPEIIDLVPFEQFVRTNPNGYFGHCHEGAKVPFSEVQNTAVFLIGPEGDFSVPEVKLALDQGYKAIHMSDFRLRTETAALLAVAHLAQLNS